MSLSEWENEESLNGKKRESLQESRCFDAGWLAQSMENCQNATIFCYNHAHALGE